MLSLATPENLKKTKENVSVLKKADNPMLVLVLFLFSTMVLRPTRSGWTKTWQMYKNVHPNRTLVLLFGCTEVECRKGSINQNF